MLSDVLHAMRLYPNNAELTSAAHAVVGLFTSVRLPPMEASQDSFVTEFMEWKAEQDRQVTAALNLLRRFQQLAIRKAFSSWTDATRQRKTLVSILKRWVQMELSERWAQWIYSCVAARAVRQASWVANAQKAHDAGEWQRTRDTAEHALSLGKHLLVLAHSGLPLSDADSVLDLSAHTAASALQDQYDEGSAQEGANERALDLLESAVEGQRHHDSEILAVSI